VVEDIRMKIDVNMQWNGTYRKTPPLKDRYAAPLPVDGFIEGVYDSSLGRVTFKPDGEYRIEDGAAVKPGKYAFFSMDAQEFLELRPASEPRDAQPAREVYAVARDEAGMVLSPVRIGVKAIERYNTASIALYALKG
jgi:hypothetical protein